MTTASTTATHPTTAGATTMPTTTKKRLDDLGDDRLVRRPGPSHNPGALRPRTGPARRATPRDRRPLGRPREVHRHAHLPRCPPRAVLPDGHVRAVDDGAAAGLAEVGLVPFASTYSVFATRRAYDFLCLDIAEPGLNVNIVGALPGLTTGYGPSHRPPKTWRSRGCPG